MGALGTLETILILVLVINSPILLMENLFSSFFFAIVALGILQILRVFKDFNIVGCFGNIGDTRLAYENCTKLQICIDRSTQSQDVANEFLLMINVSNIVSLLPLLFLNFAIHP
jgi:hypothetical protein